MARVERSSFTITVSVWRALFLREAVTRLSTGRAAWAWILLEPVVHIAFLMGLFGFVFHRMVAGVDGAMFIMTGLVSFFLVRNTTLRSTSAVSANGALFTYRQVLPVDTVLVRAGLEGFLFVVSSIVLFLGAALFGYQVLPHDPLLVLAAFFGLWLLGTGLGLMLSVGSELIPEIGNLAKMLFRPLYFVSGVAFTALAVPQPYRGWLLWNPIMQGLELVRAGFFPQFHAPYEVSLAYLYGWALSTVLLGLALHVRFVKRLVAQ